MRRLLIRPGAIGDCILALPALEHLKSEYTEVWVPSAIVPLIQFADGVRALGSTGINLLAVGDVQISAELILKLQRFDSVVSWYGENRVEFREALASFGVTCDFHRALPPADYSGHATDFFAEQVGAPPGLLPRVNVKRIPRASVVIHPFSGSPRKNWPLDYFRQLESCLPYRVEWTAGPEEELEDATRFADLAELASWIAGARLYVGNDSGITHLAAATGVRTLALLGSSSPETWIPRGQNVTILRSDLLANLEVEKVWQAVSRLLRSP